MELTTKQIKKANAIFSTLLGILVLALSVKWTYYVFTIIILIVCIPTIIYTMFKFNGFNKYMIINSLKSALCTVTGVLLFLIPKYLGLFSILTGLLVILGIILEKFAQSDETYFGTNFWQILTGIVLTIMGIAFYLPIKTEIIKYILGGLMAVLGIIVILLTKEPKQNIDDILNDYEKRYQELHRDDNQIDEQNIIEGAPIEESKEDEI